MKNKITIVILILICQISFGQKRTIDKSDSIVYNFINWKLNEDSLTMHGWPKRTFRFSDKKISWDSTVFSYHNLSKRDSSQPCWIYRTGKELLDSLFNESDRIYLYEQSILDNSSNWNLARINFKSDIDTYESSEILFSQPLFSKDGKYVFLFEIYSCGALCGEDDIILYEKQSNTTWKYLKIICGGIN